MFNYDKVEKNVDKPLESSQISSVNGEALLSGRIHDVHFMYSHHYLVIVCVYT